MRKIVRETRISNKNKLACFQGRFNLKIGPKVSIGYISVKQTHNQQNDKVWLIIKTFNICNASWFGAEFAPCYGTFVVLTVLQRFESDGSIRLCSDT